MVIITDCGGTKGDWAFKYVNGQQATYTTRGFNPVLHPIRELDLILSEELPACTEQVSAVYYYGAGVVSHSHQQKIIQSLQRFFACPVVEAEDDLLAACRATAHTQPGIVSILGTGSASCFYDGQTILDKVPSLGFIAGDEGAGSHLGRSILQAYFYREMPSDLREAFESQYDLERTKVLDNIYKQPGSNRYLGQLANFVIRHRQTPYMGALIREEFDLFIRRHLKKYKVADVVPCHFVGSIAWYLCEELAKSLHDQGMILGNIIRKPIDQLIIYHTQQQS